MVNANITNSIYDKLPNLVLGFHGCRTETFEKVIYQTNLHPVYTFLKVDYPMNDESALRDAGCFFVNILCSRKHCKDRNVS